MKRKGLLARIEANVVLTLRMVFVRFTLKNVQHVSILQQLAN